MLVREAKTGGKRERCTTHCAQHCFLIMGAGPFILVRMGGGACRENASLWVGG
jgi:hypothetical protein